MKTKLTGSSTGVLKLDGSLNPPEILIATFVWLLPRIKALAGEVTAKTQ